MTETLQAFHNDPEIKQRYLDRLRWHREQDHLIQGVGWETNGVTKGCAIGCTLEAYDHSRYPVELGLPVWMAHLQDRIFEGLLRAEALEWPERSLSAIPVGANLEPVRHRLAIRRMDRMIAEQQAALESATTEYGLRDSIEQVIAALQQVRSCHEAEADGVCDIPAWSAAESAAWSAAWSAAKSSAVYQQEANDLIELLEAA